MFASLHEDNFERSFHRNWGISIEYHSHVTRNPSFVPVRFSLRDAEVLNHVLKDIPETLVRNAAINYFFQSDSMEPQNILGIAYVYQSVMGVSSQLLQSNIPSTGIPTFLRNEVVLHEVGHMVDSFLCLSNSLGGSSSWLWERVELEDLQIPNRKTYDLLQEDWADSFTHFAYNRDWFSANFPMHHNFFARYVFYPMQVESSSFSGPMNSNSGYEQAGYPEPDKSVRLSPIVSAESEIIGKTIMGVPLIDVKSGEVKAGLILNEVSRGEFMKHYGQIGEVPAEKLYVCYLPERPAPEFVDLLHAILWRRNVELVGAESEAGVFKSVRRTEPFGTALYWRAVISEIYARTNRKLLPRPHEFRKLFSKLIPSKIELREHPELTARDKSIVEGLKKKFTNMGTSLT